MTSKPTIIQTPRLRLIPCNLEIIDAVLAGDEAIGTLLQIEVPEVWTEFGAELFKYSRTNLLEHPESENWGPYLPVYTPDNCLAGSGGFKGAPNEFGMIEIGYEIAPVYRRKGLATEMAQGLIAHAERHPEVKTVWAHTLATKSPSTRILEKCGMEKIGEFEDPEDGDIWRWELRMHRS